MLQRRLQRDFSHDTKVSTPFPFRASVFVAYASLPVAVTVGGTYTDGGFYSMHGPAGAVKPIAWLKTDNSLFKAGVRPPTEEMLVSSAKNTSEKVKRILGDIGLRNQGGVEWKMHVVRVV
ncbi:hypothetical protein K504DRAFT_486820 [Pleomassaria siparia CBS 279.74]|uniref:Uncharacterized protein n=1 Tax=Pleomassaria siparia CBS 279.74 TaxID=1314801 RepID=A0A6G1KQD6_9PLEO|nr:hypothetical protein K504DRAFT_486820 [Pleomassaria siparia CBS 279.74]